MRVFVDVSRSTCVRLYLISLQCEEAAEMQLQMDCVRLNINPVWLLTLVSVIVSILGAYGFHFVKLV